MRQIKDLDWALGVCMTPKQKEIFTVIDEYWKRFGFGPSVDDIMRMTGDKGRGNVARVCKILCEVGVCKRTPGRARSIRPVYVNIRKLV